MTDIIFSELHSIYPSLQKCGEDIYKSYEIMAVCLENGGKILCCGNGGSAADCDHFAGELLKGFLKKRPLSDLEKSRFGDRFIADNLQKGLPVISLCAHSALMTAYSNDAVPSLVFAQQVYAYAKSGDVLLCFSTSGNSENIVYAAETAIAADMKVISITGEKESALSRFSDVCIKLPETETFKVQELTLPVYHCLAAMIEDKLFEE
ncbi:MAG: SIS domain-containing protein [Clostridia bacterium]|nr:SIS domain-containing protein [Clostridia bacterium]